MDFIWEVSTQKFYDQYIEYRTLIIMVRQKSLIPTSQHLAEQILNERKIKMLIRNMSNDIHVIGQENDLIKQNLNTICDRLDLKIGIANFKKSFKLYQNIYYMTWIDESYIRCNICDFISIKNICCQSCNFITCIPCFKMCLTQKKDSCLLCNNSIIEKTIIDNVPKIFYNKYIKDKKINKNTKIENFKEEKILDFINKKIEINNNISEMAMKLYKYRNINTIEKKEIEKIQFIKACPSNECRGFLSSSYKCGICEKFFCPDCEIEKKSRSDESHVCDENIKASVALLKKSTRPCPKCSTPIEKSEGCDQMYCIVPNCKTAFSYKTGKIDNGVIHNPEYYRQQRELNNGVIPRNVGDNPCGGIPTYEDLLYATRKMTMKHETWYSYHQLINHIRHVLIPNLPTDIGNIDYEDLRVKYIVGDIDEDTWKKRLKIQIKKSEKKFRIYQILDMYVHASSDIFMNLIDKSDEKDFQQNSVKLIRYAHEQIKKINKRYNSNDRQYDLINILRY
jgi:hypothetical protein